VRDKWRNLKKSKQQPVSFDGRTPADIDNYEYACNNIVVFEKIFSEYVNAVTHQGRKLKPSINNKITKEDVTPDLAFEQKNGKYRAVNEIKAWLPNDRSRWMEVVEQLQSYDDELTNWKFSGSEKHDIMITLDPQFTNEFFDYIEKLKEKGITIDRNFSIIESSRQERAEPRIFVKKDHGIINHDKLEKEFRRGIPIIMYNIVRDLDKLKFYDANPPVIYTMMQMWDHVFSKFINSREKQIRLDTGKIVPIDLEVDKIYEKLSKLTHDSNPDCIEKGWIRNALNEFVGLGMAEPSVTSSSKFTIKYRKHSGDTREFLIKLMKKKEEAKPKPSKDGLDQYIKKEDSKKN